MAAVLRLKRNASSVMVSAKCLAILWRFSTAPASAWVGDARVRPAPGHQEEGTARRTETPLVQGGAMATERKSEAELIRALSEDLALEILASYTPEDFVDADFTSLGEAAVYLAQHEPGVGPALQTLLQRSRKRRVPDQADQV